MNLKLYPLDRQMCSLLMVSCKSIDSIIFNAQIQIEIQFSLFGNADGWTTDDLIFKWRHGDPVQVARNMHLPRFILEKFEAEYCDSTTNTGEDEAIRRKVI